MPMLTATFLASGHLLSKIHRCSTRRHHRSRLLSLCPPLSLAARCHRPKKPPLPDVIAAHHHPMLTNARHHRCPSLPNIDQPRTPPPPPSSLLDPSRCSSPSLPLIQEAGTPATTHRCPSQPRCHHPPLIDTTAASPSSSPNTVAVSSLAFDRIHRPSTPPLPSACLYLWHLAALLPELPLSPHLSPSPLPVAGCLSVAASLLLAHATTHLLVPFLCSWPASMPIIATLILHYHHPQALHASHLLHCCHGCIPPPCCPPPNQPSSSSLVDSLLPIAPSPLSIYRAAHATPLLLQSAAY